MKKIIALIMVLMLIQSYSYAGIFKHKSKTVVSGCSPQPTVMVVVPPPPVQSCAPVTVTPAPYVTPRIKIKRRLKMRGC